MNRICVLVTRIPQGPDGMDRVFGGIVRARRNGVNVGLYLLGDGVLLAKDGPMGKHITDSLDSGIMVFAGSGDLEARGIDTLVKGVQKVEDLEGLLIDDTMERSDKVITW